MKKRLFCLVATLLGYWPLALGQGNIFAFYEYAIKDGQRAAFINGYKADLAWQKTQRDNWSWIGWFVLNGPRKDRFIDATPNHEWKDFDNWVVDRAENARYNDIHFLPHTVQPTGSYRMLLEEYSLSSSNWYQAPFVQVYHITLKFGQEHLFTEYAARLKQAYGKVHPTKPFICMKAASGDELTAYDFLIPLSKQEDLASVSNLFESLIIANYSPVQAKQILQKATTSVTSIQSELWGYRSDLSQYP